jgi:hypothetical protein
LIQESDERLILFIYSPSSQTVLFSRPTSGKKSIEEKGQLPEDIQRIRAIRKQGLKLSFFQF